MFHHILVPIDGTELSTHTTLQAVELALENNAKITFIYASPDFGATSDGALMRTVAPESFAELASGSTHAVLAKALGFAEAKGVLCEGVGVISDRPHEAIIKAAQEKTCDLIFMASHGSRGLRGFIRGSQTEKVVRNSPIAVLVASVETNDPHAAMNRALAIIHDEHRSLDVVVRGLLAYSDAVLNDNAPLDIALLKRMVVYLRDFPGAQHHPKEEKFIFARLRARTHDFDLLLAQLEKQHQREHELVSAVNHALDAHAAGLSSGAKALNDAMIELSGHIHAHMGSEERTILPAARAHLVDDDWVEIDAAFKENKDPGFDEFGAGDFALLFAKIANLMPLLEKTVRAA